MSDFHQNTHYEQSGLPPLSPRSRLMAASTGAFMNPVVIAVVTCTAVAAITAKAAWNVINDPPGVTRPCVFCSPYVHEPYKSSPPPEPTR